MPSIDYSFIKNNVVVNSTKTFKSFVETGTYLAETILKMEPYFDKLYTIEISKKYFHTAVDKYKGDKISFILGDSINEMKKLCITIKENTIFFLDGHWSSGDTGKGIKDCPLIEEISDINKLFISDGIIIIDDVRLFGKGPNKGDCNEDWENITVDSILSIVKDRIDKYYYLPSEIDISDRLVIHINRI